MMRIVWAVENPGIQPGLGGSLVAAAANGSDGDLARLGSEQRHRRWGHSHRRVHPRRLQVRGLAQPEVLLAAVPEHLGRWLTAQVPHHHLRYGPEDCRVVPRDHGNQSVNQSITTLSSPNPHMLEQIHVLTIAT